MSKIRVLLVDDHSLFREGLRNILKSQDDFEIVGEASDGIDPMAEDMTVTVGSYMLTIPGGSFSSVVNGGYHYRGTIEGSEVEVMVRLPGDGVERYDFFMTIKNIDLAGTANPLTIGLAIGNEGGNVEKRLQGVLTNNRLRELK